MNLRDKLFGLIKSSALLGVVVIIWYGSVFLAMKSKVPAGDMAELLFGAASFATFMLSILFAVLAIVGWQKISEIIDRQVERAFERQRENYDREIKGRHYAASGLVAAFQAYDPVKFRVTSRERLEDGIRYFQIALKEFPSDKDFHLTILNNLVFSLCMRGEKRDRSFVLGNADKLLATGQDTGKRFMVLTACRAIFQYSEDSKQIRMAKEILREMRSNTHEGVLESEKGEASVHLAWLRLNRPNV